MNNEALAKVIEQSMKNRDVSLFPSCPQYTLPFLIELDTDIFVDPYSMAAMYLSYPNNTIIELKNGNRFQVPDKTPTKVMEDTQKSIHNHNYLFRTNEDIIIEESNNKDIS